MSKEGDPRAPLVIDSFRRRKLILGKFKFFIVLTIIIVLLIVGYLVVEKLKSRRQKITLKELIQSDTTMVQIRDTALIKKIILDSLDYLNGVYQDLQSIEVYQDEAINKIDSFQDISLANSTPLTDLLALEKISKIMFTPLNLLTGERELTRQEGKQLETLLKSMPFDKTKYFKFAGVGLDPTSHSLDIRRFGVTPTIADQGSDGTCWAFAAVGAYEISYQLRKGRKIRASEQQVLDCSGIVSDRGGLAYRVFEWLGLGQKNLADNDAYPYTGKIAPTCGSTAPPTDYYAQAWHLVIENSFAIAPIMDIKRAICKYGSVVSCVNVTEAWKGMHESLAANRYIDRTSYREPNNDYSSNHSVLIIGWDDTKQAWLVKNSWGNDWGSTCGFGTQRGYLWLDYGSCNIGKRAAWVLAR